MENKPNLKIAEMIVTRVLTMDYRNAGQENTQKNKPNSNPNKPNFMAFAVAFLRVLRVLRGELCRCFSYSVPAVDKHTKTKYHSTLEGIFKMAGIA
jgi:hypothetical protein